MTIPSKLPDVGISIFTRVGQMARAAGALNLAQGFPDFGVDPELPRLIDHYTRAGYNQYAPDVGVAELRRAISGMLGLLYGYAPDVNQEITVTIGATEGLFSSFQALIHPGDEVIYCEPAYDSYAPGIRLAGGTPVAVHMEPPGFDLSPDRIAAKISPRTRMIVLNNPHNPTGRVFSSGFMQELTKLLHDTDILLLSDEVYHNITHEGRHESVLRYPGLRQRAVVAMSFGKTFHATGWRVGYVVAPPKISKEIRRVHQFNTFSAYTPVQYALADYLAQPERYLGLAPMFRAKRDRFLAGVSSGPYRVLPCAGGYFACLDFSQHAFAGSDLELVERLIREFGIAAIPLGEFYAPPRRTGILRFCFAKEDEKLDRAAALLNSLRL